MRRKLEFFFDYASPFSYLADQRLDGIRARTGCELIYRPMLLGGVFKATGNSSPAVEPVEAKRNYGMRELQRFAARCDAPFQMNPHFPVNSLGIMRGAYAALAADVFPPTTERCFKRCGPRERICRIHSLCKGALWGGPRGRGAPGSDTGTDHQREPQANDRGSGGARCLRGAEFLRGRRNVFRKRSRRVC